MDKCPKTASGHGLPISRKESFRNSCSQCLSQRYQEHLLVKGQSKFYPWSRVKANI